MRSCRKASGPLFLKPAIYSYMSANADAGEKQIVAYDIAAKVIAMSQSADELDQIIDATAADLARRTLFQIDALGLTRDVRDFAEPVPPELGIGWRVLLVTWYPGQTEYLGGFECEQNAVHWIKFKSQVWVGT
jgi:hypothetical protein